MMTFCGTASASHRATGLRDTATGVASACGSRRRVGVVGENPYNTLHTASRGTAVRSRGVQGISRPCRGIILTPSGGQETRKIW